MGACAGGDRSAISVGDISVSRSDLIDITFATNPGGPDELPATLDNGMLRNIANALALDAAVVTVLAEQGITMSESEAAAIDAQINDGIASAQLRELDPEGGAFAALRRNLWASSFINGLDPDSVDQVQELLADVEVESRLGVYNPETTLIAGR